MFSSGTVVPLIVDIYILGLTDGIDSIYLFDPHSKNKNDNWSTSGTTVLLKFDTLHLLENYIRSLLIKI